MKIKQRKNKIPSDVRFIIKNINKTLDVDLINDNSRDGSLVDARRIYFHISRNNTDYSALKLASYINRDHSTCIYHSKKCEQFLVIDKEFKEIYNKILLTIPKSDNVHLLRNKAAISLSNYRYYKQKIRQNERTN